MLTGLRNRRGFVKPAAEAFAQARGGRCGVAVLVVDVDHFKRVNDRYGHDAGDAVIRHVGTLLAEAVRGTDTVARFGGEEFVVLLVGLDGAEAAQIAERLCVKVRAAEIAHGGRIVAVTVSIGGGDGCRCATRTSRRRSPGPTPPLRRQGARARRVGIAVAREEAGGRREPAGPTGPRGTRSRQAPLLLHQSIHGVMEATMMKGGLLWLIGIRSRSS